MAIFKRKEQQQQQQIRLRSSKGGKKSSSLNFEENDVGNGVFVSSRTLFSFNPSPPSSFASSLDDSENSFDEPAVAWKTTGTHGYNKGTPLAVTNPDKEETIDDPEAKLEQVVARNRKLPGTWYYSSNHILVNQERARRGIAPLHRMRELDAIARSHAGEMAATRSVHHVDLDVLRIALCNKTTRRLGENVTTGTSIWSIHERMMGSLSEKKYY